MNFATIEAASLISIANAHVESTFKSIKKSAPGVDALWRPVCKLNLG
ncbi:hypothetical protein BN194_12910 [Lacticaseibacillus paracasei]|uniref:Transposase n=2 Tax=Pleetrevirus TaxID=2843438 RepID=A0A1B0YA67_9CAUD|nr:hypothetical protein iLp84_55 [Lactobacillus phage iLp84]YP_009292695.1 hypothetical protein BIZ66_gp55 [Lactobacillus phage PLE3]EPC82403.1 hypothetical protein Lpp37_08666 [Lacticaseibacillus paracasei subsp. paracasei Lpp37]CCK22238.1 hypothetical protein BN194_12910 [Lacticaseibacillus paracasei]ALJ97887.1 hypothetical protein iLp84_55 [Lactobacillus phage iLp84]ANJ65454.1 hypothetical protein PLE3_55 [Lactobacillus phage PLE3]